MVVVGRCFRANWWPSGHVCLCLCHCHRPIRRKVFSSKSCFLHPLSFSLIFTFRMRTLRILVIAGLWHIAMAMGNLAAGLLLKFLTFVGLLAVSAGCHLLSLAYTIVFIHEKQEKKDVTLRSILSCHRFYDGLAAVLRPREKGLRVVGCLSAHQILLLLLRW